MKFNPVMIQKALCHLATAISYLGTSISAGPGDIEEYHEIMRARKAISGASSGGPAPRPEPQRRPSRTVTSSPSRDAETLPKAVPSEERRPADRPAQSFGLPEKPMKKARMDEFLKSWLPGTKAKPVKSSGGFAAGMGCSIDGVEHSVAAVYDNGVALVCRHATQYRRLVPVDRLDGLYPVESGYEWRNPPKPGDRVEACLGMKGAPRPTSFRPAVVSSVRGSSMDVRYLDNDASSTVSMRHARPSR